MRIQSALYEAQDLLKMMDECYEGVPPQVFAALDAAIDIIEKAEALNVAFEIGGKDVNMCSEDIGPCPTCDGEKVIRGVVRGEHGKDVGIVPCPECSKGELT